MFARSTDIEKCFDQKLFKVKFPAQKYSGRISLSPPGVELGVPNT